MIGSPGYPVTQLPGDEDRGTGQPGNRATRIFALLAFAAIAVGSFQTLYLDIWRRDAAQMRAQWTELPYRKLPGLRQLLVEADRRTPQGARILLATPHKPGEGGYRYAYARALYILAGRELVPLLDPTSEKRVPLRLESVDYIACWGDCAAPRGFAVIWKSNDGALLRRVP